MYPLYLEKLAAAQKHRPDYTEEEIAQVYAMIAALDHLDRQVKQWRQKVRPVHMPVDGRNATVTVRRCKATFRGSVVYVGDASLYIRPTDGKALKAIWPHRVAGAGVDVDGATAAELTQIANSLR